MAKNETNSTSIFTVNEGDLDSIANILAIIVPISFGLIVIVGLLGNALVVTVVVCNPTMRSTTNLLIINLAIADLLFIVLCVPFTATDYALQYWPFGDLCCRTVQYFIHVCAYASIYTLVLMSLDRFLAVVHPITSMSVRTERNAMRAIIATWIIVIVLSLPAMLMHSSEIELDNNEIFLLNSTAYHQSLEKRSGFDQHEASLQNDFYNNNNINTHNNNNDIYSYNNNGVNMYSDQNADLININTKNENDDEESFCTFATKKYNHQIFQLSFFVSAFVIPLTLAFILYMLMLKRLWFGVVPGGQMSTESVRCKKRVTRLVVVVVVIFAVCWMPIQIILLLKSFHLYPMNGINLTIQIIAQILAYMNSCVNPIIYAFLSDNFRKAFHKVIACGNRTSDYNKREDFERTGAEVTVGSCNARNTKLTKDSQSISNISKNIE